MFACGKKICLSTLHNRAPERFPNLSIVFSELDIMARQVHHLVTDKQVVHGVYTQECLHLEKSNYIIFRFLIKIGLCLCFLINYTNHMEFLGQILLLHPAYTVPAVQHWWFWMEVFCPVSHRRTLRSGHLHKDSQQSEKGVLKALIHTYDKHTLKSL